jgi:hypothetical protein
MPATWGKNTLTNQALTMMNQALGISAITFTKAVTITDDITGNSVSQLQALTSVNYKQSRTPKAIATQDNKSRLGVTIDNSDVNEDYVYYGVGLYAKQNSTNQEVLFSVIPLTAGATMIAKENNSATASIYLDLYTDIVRGTQVTIMVSDSGTLSREDVQQMISQSLGKYLVYPNDTASTGIDFDTILDIGITRIINDTTVLNAPSGFSGTGYLTTIGSGDKTVPIVQTLDDTINSIRSTRYFNSTTNVWSEWNAYAKTVDVNQQLDKKVNIADMRKPANDVAGIEEVNTKQDKIGYTPADDSKVVHSTVTQLNSTDMNTVLTAGFYQLNSGTNGMPNADAWTIYQVIPLTSSNGVQLAYETNNTILGMRSWNRNPGVITFTSWVRFADDSKVVHTTDTSNWQKQAMFNPGDYKIDTTSPTTDFATLLRSKYDKAGVVYIRENNGPSYITEFIDAVVICEGGGYWYAYGIGTNGNFAHRQITPASDTGWIINADDSKVAHLSGANNFDTVPTVNNNPLLLASSLPSDLARTGQANTFTAAQTFSIAPVINDASKDKGDNQAATMADLKSVEKSAWHDLTTTDVNGSFAVEILYQKMISEKKLRFIFIADYKQDKDLSNYNLAIDLSKIITKFQTPFWSTQRLSTISDHPGMNYDFNANNGSSLITCSKPINWNKSAGSLVFATSFITTRTNGVLNDTLYVDGFA